ncbi:helix-turn-helix domain-containing protein [Nitrincola alkalisediminis]|uniref:helix-turn-helix domain-containing protein n=1 Tax=Nitrincola alkalisediminis TaxID=1366656 RepID=UPI001873E091|nr:helix-turn-helix domain-containing protein [Nitrincola alkalisediminis]
MSLQVPHFVLYGETVSQETTEFVHIERISARSRENDWVIDPHRHSRLFQIIVIVRGQVRAIVDETRFEGTGCMSVSIPAGVVHGFQFQPETEGYVLTFAQSLLQQDADRTRPYFEPLLSQGHCLHFDEAPMLFTRLVQCLDTLQDEFRGAYAGRTLMCEWLVRAVMMTLSRVLQTHREMGAEQPAMLELTRLRELIEDHYVEHWRVTDYAQALNMTKTRLNRLCNTAFGKSLKVLLSERLLLEAKRKLMYTRGNIDQIAFDLGFDDPGYFSRFFKSHTGQTPLRYRVLSDLDSK